MDTRIAPSQQAEQLLNTLKKIRVPSRKINENDKELNETLARIGLLSDMNQEVKDYFIQSGKDMIATATCEEDRNRAFVLLCTYAHEHNQLVGSLIKILNHYSVIDDCNKEIEAGTATGKTYKSRGVSSYTLHLYNQAQQDFETAVRYLSKEIETGTATGETYEYRGVSYYYLHQETKAQKDLKTAVKLGDPDAKEILAELRAKLEQSTNAGTSLVEQESGLVSKAKHFVGKLFGK